MMQLLAQAEQSFWMPEGASSYSDKVDMLFYGIFWLCVVMFVLITAIMAGFIILYRRREGHKEKKTATHSTAMELTWTIIPTIVVMVIFYFGFAHFLYMVTPPPNPYEITVSSFKWGWQFEYPNGHKDSDLYLPVDRDIRLILTSRDVIHSLYIPAFRAKKDCVPGRYNQMWFRPTKVGEYDLFCAEYCGQQHSSMIAKVYVKDGTEFENWLEEAANILGTMPPAEAGKILYARNQCITCHGNEGQGVSGPKLAEIFGKPQDMADGMAVVADENYLRESILNPAARIVKGYPNAMPAYQGMLNDDEVKAIIEYIKSMTEGYVPPEQPNTEQMQESEDTEPVADDTQAGKES